MNQDPNLKVQMCQVLLVLLALFLVIFLFYKFYMSILIGITMYFLDRYIDEIKEKDGLNEQRQRIKKT